MKPVLFILLGLGVLTAHADLVMQQQITAEKNSSAVTVKVKGAKIRVDMYVGQPQAISTIKDLRTGETLTLVHNQKIFVKQVEAPTKKTAPSVIAPKVRKTGQTQIVGGYDTDIYTWTNARGLTGFFWVAKNYPDFVRLKSEIAALDNTASGMNDGMTPALSSLPGMVLRTQITGGGQTFTVSLVSARAVTLNAADFQVPASYRSLPVPKPLPQQVPKKTTGK